jgi:hypothetical protein
MWRALEATSAHHLSTDQTETFVRTAYNIIDAINGRALPQDEAT